MCRFESASFAQIVYGFPSSPEDRALVSPYLGEIKLLPYKKIPKGWHICDGTVLTVGANPSLFSLIGAAYGGDGVKTFALPNLMSRTPLGVGLTKTGDQYTLGQMGGQESVALTKAELPTHNHAFQVSSQAGTATGAVNAIYAQVQSPQPASLYGRMSATPVTIDPSSVVPAGSGMPHNNMQPYVAMIYCIATVGVYPTRGP